jgi:hypothetical protein
VVDVEWDLSGLEEVAVEPEDIEASLPTRIRTPPPMPLPRFDWPPVTIIPRERLPPWTLPAPPRRTARKEESRTIWRVLLLSGALVSVGLLVLVIRAGSVVSFRPARAESVPPPAVPVNVSGPVVVPMAPPSVAPVEVAEDKRPRSRVHRPRPPAARPALAVEPPPLDQHRPNPF